MRPVIALSSRFSDKADTWRIPVTSLGRTYQDAIVRAGGQPVAIPPMRETLADLTQTLARFDGLCLPGGPDVDPRRYGATEVDPTVYGVNPHHDDLEIALVHTALSLGMPILAICRGMQVLNVAMGGTLIQHLDELTDDHRFQRHSTLLVDGCKTAIAMGTTTPVGHSVHHQALDRVADGLVVTGRAPDGTIDAVEAPDGWVVAVQWHPEDDAATNVEQQLLFDSFVQTCEKWRASL